jgi:hypothetical protein
MHFSQLGDRSDEVSISLSSVLLPFYLCQVYFNLVFLFRLLLLGAGIHPSLVFRLSGVFLALGIRVSL